MSPYISLYCHSSHTFIFFDDLGSFEEYKVFCRPSHNWYLTDAFLMIKLRPLVLEMKPTEIKYHSHHVTSMVHVINVTYHVDVIHSHLVFVRFLHSFSPFPYCLPWKEVPVSSPYFRGLHSISLDRGTYIIMWNLLYWRRLFAIYLLI